MTDTVRRLAKLPKKEQQSVLFHFPPELMRILFVEVYDLDCNTAVQCAKTCQELFAHVQPVLWTLVPGLNPARLGRADRYSLVYQITGIEAGEEPSVEAIVGPLRLTQHLSLHFTDEDYQQYPAEIDSNTKEVAQRFPETKHFESLTTTPETTIHTSD